MTLQSDIAAQLPFLRAAAESLMLDTLAFGTIARGGQNEETGEEGETFAATFTTPGKIAGQGKDLNVRMVEIGGVERPVISGGIHIPASRPEQVPAGMFVKVTRVGPTSPRHLLGRVYRIEGESVKSHETARRFDVVEV